MDHRANLTILTETPVLLCAVVDPTLRVHELEGLRIADASIFPTIPTVNPMVAALMVAGP